MRMFINNNGEVIFLIVKRILLKSEHNSTISLDKLSIVKQK